MFYVPIYFKKTIAILACIFPFNVYAGDANNPDWQIDIAPYLWAISMNGTVSNGPLTTHVSESFSQLMRYFNGGGMLWMDLYKGPFGVFVNGLFTDLTDKNSIDGVDLKLTSHFGIVTYGLSYIVFQQETQKGRIQLEPYAGVRYTFDNVALKLETLPTAHSNQDWTDIIAGLRVRDDLNARWVVSLAGDLGGKNVHTQYSTNVVGLLGYKPASKSFSNSTFYLGYRYLHQHYVHGSGIDYFDWNMHLFGPLLGVNFNFGDKW